MIKQIKIPDKLKRIRDELLERLEKECDSIESRKRAENFNREIHKVTIEDWYRPLMSTVDK